MSIISKEFFFYFKFKYNLKYLYIYIYPQFNLIISNMKNKYYYYLIHVKFCNYF